MASITNKRAIILLSQMYLPAFDEEEKEALTLAINTLSDRNPVGKEWNKMRVEWQCPRCYQRVRRDDKFCNYCGIALKEVEWE